MASAPPHVNKVAWGTASHITAIKNIPATKDPPDVVGECRYTMRICSARTLSPRSKCTSTFADSGLTSARFMLAANSLDKDRSGRTADPVHRRKTWFEHHPRIAPLRQQRTRIV